MSAARYVGSPLERTTHPVLVVAEGGGPQPQRAVSPYVCPASPSSSQRALDLTRGARVERALAEERVELDAVALERALDLRQQDLDGPTGQLVRLGLGGPGICAASSAT